MALIYSTGCIYGSFLKTTDRGLKIPGDKVCQWTFYSYIIIHEVVNDTCRTS